MCDNHKIDSPGMYPYKYNIHRLSINNFDWNMTVNGHILTINLSIFDCFYLQGLYYNFVWLLCYANLPPGVHTWETHCLRIKESLFVKNTAQPAKWL